MGLDGVRIYSFIVPLRQLMNGLWTIEKVIKLGSSSFYVIMRCLKTLGVSKFQSINGKEWRMNITFWKIYAKDFCKKFTLLVQIVKSSYSCRNSVLFIKVSWTFFFSLCTSS